MSLDRKIRNNYTSYWLGDASMTFDRVIPFQAVIIWDLFSSDLKDSEFFIFMLIKHYKKVTSKSYKCLRMSFAKRLVGMLRRGKI